VRVTLYRRLLKAASSDEVMELRKEMEDRFGPLPEPTRLLVDLTLIRNCGGAAGLRSVSVTRRETKVRGVFQALASALKGRRGWTVLGESALGPGGAGGIRTLVEAMSEAEHER
jgi:transcription-repair coupling factor (superfamily II helicase)